MFLKLDLLLLLLTLTHLLIYHILIQILQALNNWLKLH